MLRATWYRRLDDAERTRDDVIALFPDMDFEVVCFDLIERPLNKDSTKPPEKWESVVAASEAQGFVENVHTPDCNCSACTDWAG